MVMTWKKDIFRGRSHGGLLMDSGFFHTVRQAMHLGFTPHNVTGHYMSKMTYCI